jgi:hypothetical protein
MLDYCICDIPKDVYDYICWICLHPKKVDNMSNPYRPVSYFVQDGIYINNRDPENRFLDKPSWAIVKQSFCLNKDLVFEYEPLPSSRDDDFLSRTRFSLEDALNLVEKYLKSKNYSE